MNIKLISVLTGSLLFLSMSINCGGKLGNNPKSSKDFPGKSIYEANCSPCHGMKGEGDGPAGANLNPKPRNYAKDGFKYGSSIEEVKRTVLEGIDGTAMPPWSNVLSDEQIVQVAEYVKFLASQSVE